MIEGYEKLKTVGKGSFGTATLYRRQADNKYVVIKEILTMDLDDEEKNSASNEVDVISTLDHQNIIRYIESFESEGSLKIIMEYADGGNLAQLIKQKKQKNDIFTEGGILDIIFQISCGLSYMHSKKILHRDLKTANVFISMNGVIKLGDFGISKMLHTKSQAYTVVGTPYYLSPEMCEGYNYNEKSDIWAMGCVLYELATLRKPFSAQNLHELVQKITACQYEDIPEMYTKDLSRTISLMLQRNPENRPYAKDIYEMLIPKIENKVHRNIPTENDQSAVSSPQERSILYELRNFCDEKVITPIDLPIKKIINLAVGPTHSLIVTADHLVYGWGENNHGQLALGICDYYKKYPAQATSLRDKNIVKSAAGRNFSLYLNSQGLVFSCGDGSKGCLGHENFTSVIQPEICESLTTSVITDICCGTHHCVALSADGRIFCWGLSKYGELGLGPIKQRNKPTHINLPTKIARIFCSEDATIVLTTNERVLVAGRNNFNKLGFSHGGNIRTFHALVHDYGPIKNVSMSSDRILLVNEDGHLILIGKRNSKNHNHGSTTGPQVIKMSSKIVLSACTSRYISIIDQQNVVWFWGSYQRRINGESSLNSDWDKTRNVKYNSVVSLSSSDKKSNVKQLLSSSFETVYIKDPKSILALFSSVENIRTSNIIHLVDIKAKDNYILVLVNTTTPPHTKTFSTSYIGNSSLTSQEEFSLGIKHPILKTM